MEKNEQYVTTAFDRNTMPSVRLTQDASPAAKMELSSVSNATLAAGARALGSTRDFSLRLK